MNLNKFITKTLEDMKAIDLLEIDVTKKSNFTDHMFIVSGRSTRHIKAIAEELCYKAKKSNIEVIGSEGQESSNWVLVDFGETVVNIMETETRELYQLEKLWG